MVVSFFVFLICASAPGLRYLLYDDDDDGVDDDGGDDVDDGGDDVDDGGDGDDDGGDGDDFISMDGLWRRSRGI
ncbi:hypothetical protein SOVF_155940 [Spinacia oleracea]|nr:hypothetical protein SOVF_155940 [Spinacia oleracea]